MPGREGWAAGPGQALVVRRIAESEMFYKNNIEYFIFPIFSETFYSFVLFSFYYFVTRTIPSRGLLILQADAVSWTITSHARCACAKTRTVF